MVAWSCGSLGVRENAMMDRESSARIYKLFKSVKLHFKLTSINSYCNTPLQDNIAVEASRKIRTFTPQAKDTCIITKDFSKKTGHGTDATIRFFCNCRCQNLANMAWAFATLDVRERLEFYSGIASSIWPLFEVTRNYFRPYHWRQGRGCRTEVPFLKLVEWWMLTFLVFAGIQSTTFVQSGRWLVNAINTLHRFFLNSPYGPRVTGLGLQHNPPNR